MLSGTCWNKALAIAAKIYAKPDLKALCPRPTLASTWGQKKVLPVKRETWLENFGDRLTDLSSC